MSWKADSNKRALAILRVSSVAQKDNTSHVTQAEAIENYCKENGLELIRAEKIIESAKDSSERKQYQSQIQYALTNGIRHLIFYVSSREARNYIDMERNEWLVREDKIVIHYVADCKVIHSKSPDSDFFMRDANALFNKHYSRELSTKVRGGMNAKAKLGMWPGSQPPLGYVLRKPLDINGNPMKTGASVEVDSNSARVNQVLREFELRASGYSYDKIREIILKEGFIPSSKAKTYHRNIIERRLKNKMYWGKFDWKRQEYQGKHPVFIPTHILQAVAATHSNSRITRPINAINGIFSGGFLRCSECGCQVTYDPKSKTLKGTGQAKTYHLYRCSNSKKTHKSLRGMNIEEGQLWAQFEKVLDEIQIPESTLSRIAKVLEEEHKSSKDKLKQEQKNYRDMLEALDRKEANATDSVISGAIDKEAYQLLLAKLRKEKDECRQKLEAAALLSHDAFAETYRFVFELAKGAKEIWKLATPLERLDLLKHVCSNQVLDKQNVLYELKKPFALLALAQVEQEEKLKPVHPKGEQALKWLGC